MPIIPEEFLKRYADSNSKDPKVAISMVMWLMIYDEKPSSWARDFFEETGVLTQPEDDEARKSQIQKVRRWRNAAEKSVRLPPRGKRGASSAYKQALQDWKRINPRPTDEDLLAGWTPQSLPPTSGIEIEDNQAAKKSNKAEKAAVTPPEKTTETKKIEDTAAVKRLFKTGGVEDQNKKTQGEPNELLDAVDAELRKAGIPFD